MAVTLLTLRYIKTRKVALVAAVCLALSVAAMVVITAVMDGLRARRHAQVRGSEPDLAFALEQPREDHEEALQRILANAKREAGGPLLAVSPRLESYGLLWSQIANKITGTSTTLKEGVRLVGIDWASEREILALEAMMQAVPVRRLRANFPLDADPLHGPVGRILVSERLAEDLRLAPVGKETEGTTSRVTIMTGRRGIDTRGEEVLAPQSRHFDVLGTFVSERSDLDLQVFIDRFALHELRYGRGGRQPTAGRLVGRVDPSAGADIEVLAARLRAAHPGLRVSTWRDANQSLLAALDIEKTTVSVILGLIVFITVALILGILWLLVLEKVRDIGILRSMGLSQRGILLVFVGYAGCLGFVGAAAGAGLGVFCVQNLDAIMQRAADGLGLEVFRAEVGYEFQSLPAILSTLQVLAIAGFAFGLALLSGAAAAIRAVRLDPIRCLRTE